MAETIEDFGGLYLLACVCAQEAQKSAYPVLPIDFPKKERSLRMRRPKSFHKPQSSSPFRTSDNGVLGFNLRVSATVLGKRCSFSHEEEESYRKKQRRPSGPEGLNHNLQTQLPRNFVDRIEAMGGSDVKRVIEKKLTKTDLVKGNNRISMPLTQIQSEFLTEDEKESLTRCKEDGKHLMGIDVLLWDPFLDQSTKLCLKKWDFNNNSSCYMLIENWFNVAEKNRLRAGMNIQMWSFRVNQSLCFALVY